MSAGIGNLPGLTTVLQLSAVVAQDGSLLFRQSGGSSRTRPPVDDYWQQVLHLQRKQRGPSALPIRVTSRQLIADPSQFALWSEMQSMRLLWRSTQGRQWQPVSTRQLASSNVVLKIFMGSLPDFNVWHQFHANRGHHPDSSGFQSNAPAGCAERCSCR